MVIRRKLKSEPGGLLRDSVLQAGRPKTMYLELTGIKHDGLLFYLVDDGSETKPEYTDQQDRDLQDEAASCGLTLDQWLEYLASIGEE